MTKLYAAYGANTHLESMAHRCPDARPIAAIVLYDWKLVFRGVADLVEAPGEKACCALWEITDEDERALDRFEGFPNLYVKREFEIVKDGEVLTGMFYVMRDARGTAPPPRYYEETLRAGYEDFGMNTAQIDRAIREATGRKAQGHAKRASLRGG